MEKLKKKLKIFYLAILTFVVVISILKCILGRILSRRIKTTETLLTPCKIQAQKKRLAEESTSLVTTQIYHEKVTLL